MNSAKKQDTKIIFRSWLHFYTPIMKYQKAKLRNNPIYKCIKKNETPGNKCNQGGKRPVTQKVRTR